MNPTTSGIVAAAVIIGIALVWSIYLALNANLSRDKMAFRVGAPLALFAIAAYNALSGEAAVATLAIVGAVAVDSTLARRNAVAPVPTEAGTD